MRQYLISIFIVICLISAKDPVHAQTLMADYEFQNSLVSSIPGAPDLLPLGFSSFASETVDGDSRTVLQFDIGSGLQLSPTTEIINNDEYTIVILFRFDDIGEYKKVVDYKNRTDDEGLYYDGGYLDFYDVAESPSQVMTANTYVQMVITRDSINLVKGYTDGSKDIEFIDTDGLGIIDTNNSLFFFLDDSDTGFDEISGGAVARLRIYDGVLSETEVAALSTFGPVITRGDITDDGLVTIQDVVVLARILVGSIPSPSEGTDAFSRADANANGVLEVGDIIHTVDIILKLVPSKPAVNTPSYSTVTMHPTQLQQDGTQVVPISLKSDGVLAGLQASLSIDGDYMTFGNPYLGEENEGISITHHEIDGVLRLVVYSTSGQKLPSDGSPLVFVPVSLIHDGRLAGSLSLDHVILADSNAGTVPAPSGNQTIKIEINGLPGVFSLEPARPNPFNPSTRISYTLPRQTHVFLTVYNLLGQEIIRLVNQEQAAGRYTVTWTGVNTQGSPVASGVYMYRLDTGTGYQAIRRVTLLK